MDSCWPQPQDKENEAVNIAPTMKGRSGERTQINIVRNIIQEGTINRHFWNSLTKANLCSPAPPTPLQYTRGQQELYLHREHGSVPNRTKASGDFTVLLASFSCNRAGAAKDAINKGGMGNVSNATLTAVGH